MSALLKCLKGEILSRHPVWFMRQAGRYLPEFRRIRSDNPDFIKLCLDSVLSSEITLQPIKRFNLDAAIIFSDILMIPYALNQKVEFKENTGPVLSSFNLDEFKSIKIEDFTEKLLPVYKSLTKTRKKLDKNKSLIAFAGAPWTLFMYMLQLKKNNNKLDDRKLEINLKTIEKTISTLTKYICIHLEEQISAGADVIQIFDSWAGLIPQGRLKTFCYDPHQEIVNHFKKKNIPIICFPKGIGKNYKEFNHIVRPSGINIDYDVNPAWAAENLENTCIQGGMDPKFLLGDEKNLLDEVEKFLKIFEQKPYIFNLGHGILPETDPNVLDKVIKKVIS